MAVARGTGLPEDSGRRDVQHNRARVRRRIGRIIPGPVAVVMKRSTWVVVGIAVLALAGAAVHFQDHWTGSKTARGPAPVRSVSVEVARAEKGTVPVRIEVTTRRMSGQCARIRPTLIRPAIMGANAG